jgi:hypothetical protein
MTIYLFIYFFVKQIKGDLYCQDKNIHSDQLGPARPPTPSHNRHGRIDRTAHQLATEITPRPN